MTDAPAAADPVEFRMVTAANAHAGLTCWAAKAGRRYSVDGSLSGDAGTVRLGCTWLDTGEPFTVTVPGGHPLKAIVR